MRDMQGGYVYIMSNRRDGTLYVGVTADVVRRVYQRRTGVGSGFVRHYGLKRLVYLERHEDIMSAIRREKTLKDWNRAWKVRLIQRLNPEWEDLFPSLV